MLTKPVPNSFYATEFLGEFTRGPASASDSNAPRIIELDGFGHSFPDADADGVVGFSDLLVLSQHYGSVRQTEATGDFTGDGAVGFNDLLVLAQAYGVSVPSVVTPIPEPTTVSAASVLVLCLRRKR